jgi:hypothetical protein
MLTRHSRFVARSGYPDADALNRHTLGGIQTDPTNPNFGKVTSVSGYRTCQVVARLNF